MSFDAKSFWRDGFAVMPGVFEPSEVERWRKAAIAHDGNPADLLSDDTLREVILDERVLSVAREILGDELIYFGDSTVAVGYNGWGFHKDNSDRLDANAPDWSVDRYPIIRFGIYTQSHDPEPGGLELRRGSHLVADYRSGEYVTPRIRPGDLLVWNFRTSHSAGVRKLKHTHLRVPHHPLINRLNLRVNLEWAMRQPRVKRVAIFTSFATRHPLLDRHIEYLKQRAYPWELWQASNWSEDTRKKVAERGIELIDTTAFRYDGRERHIGYHQMPY